MTTESNAAISDTERTSRIVRGGATMFPQEPAPRPQPVGYLHLLKSFAIKYTRGPLYAVLATKLLHPLYVKWATAALSKAGGHTESSLFVSMMMKIHCTYITLSPL
jgi:hypothetical protein